MGDKTSSRLAPRPISDLQAAKNVKTNRPKTFAALGHRNYQLYFIGQLISVAGTWMQVIAQAWLVYQISHSEFALGVVGFASSIPVLFITPWGGVTADMLPKRTVIVITQTLSMLLAFILAVLCFTNVVQVWHIVVLAVLLGIVNSFDMPARQAFVVEMVGREDLTNAIAMNSMMFNGARVVGPAIGGILLATLGSSWCFLINGLSFFAVIVGLLLMRLSPTSSQPDLSRPWQHLVAGVKYTAGRSEIVALLALSAVYSLFGLSYASLLPAFTDQVLHSGASGYGAINTAIGFGAVTGALLIARYGIGSHRGKWLLIASFTFPLFLGFFAVNNQFIWALPLTYGLGVGFMILFNSINSLLQSQVTDEMRGRVLSLYTLSFSGVSPFGNLMVGTLSEKWGMNWTFLACAVVTILLAIVIYSLAPKVRQL